MKVISRHSKLAQLLTSRQNEVYTEKMIAHLPRPVQKYYRNCGYIGQPILEASEIIWDNVYHKRNEKSGWMKLMYKQINMTNEPTRIVGIKAKFKSATLINISEEYVNGVGSWKMTFLKIFSLINQKGRKELNLTGLVTFLSEALLVPAIGVASYVEWHEIDEKHAKATINHRDMSVSGVFTFNDEGEFTCFETMDRYHSEDGKSYTPMKWRGSCGEYLEKQGIKYPTQFTAEWETAQGRFQYFKGHILSINDLNILNFHP